MIKILKPSVDDAEYEGNPVLRGVVHNDDLKKLRIDEQYQREFLAKGTRRHILAALSAKERLPDLELAMRGDRFNLSHINDPRGNIATLLDPVFIIDGQQRRGTIIEFLGRFPKAPVRQGAIIHFNTNMEWEKSRFQSLNLSRTKVASAILIRNMRNQHPSIATLYGLSTSDREFALFDRVSWQQTPNSGHLMTATAFLGYTLYLHSHLAATRMTVLMLLAQASDRVVARIGLSMYRKNVMTYWGAVDSIWGIRAVTSRGAVWLKGGFQKALIEVISRHTDFWRDDIEFIMPYDVKKKLKLLNMNDPEIIRLAGASGLASVALEQILIRWINSGKRTGHLRPRTINDQIDRESRADELQEPLPMAAQEELC